MQSTRRLVNRLSLVGTIFLSIALLLHPAALGQTSPESESPQLPHNNGANETPDDLVLMREAELRASLSKLERIVSELEPGDERQKRAAWGEASFAADVLQQNAALLKTMQFEDFRKYSQAVSQAAADFRKVAEDALECAKDEEYLPFKRRYRALAAVAQELAEKMDRLVVSVEADHGKIERQAMFVEKSERMLTQIEALANSYLKVSSAIAAINPMPLDLVSDTVRSGQLRPSAQPSDETRSSWERLAAEFVTYQAELDRYESCFRRFAKAQDELCAKIIHEERSTSPEISIRSPDGKVLVEGEDIAHYEWATHTITLRPGVREKLRKYTVDRVVRGVPFELTVNGEIVYDGVFTSLVSSRVFKTPVILLDFASDDESSNDIQVSLGYPTKEFFQGDDPRDDDRIKRVLQVLKRIAR